MHKLIVCRVRDVKVCKRAHSTDSGIDFFIPKIKSVKHDVIFTPRKQTDQYEARKARLFHSSILLPAFTGVLIPSGIKVHLEEGYDLVFEARSGLTRDFQLIISGVVDTDYTGEVGLSIFNPTSEAVVLEEGQKVLQGIIRKVSYCQIEEVDEVKFKEITEKKKESRGDKGFNSTGER